MKIIGEGALPDFLISEMMDENLVKNANEKCINPSSLDLTITSDIWRMENLVLPHNNETVAEMLLLKQVNVIKHDIKMPLEVNIAYCICLNEELNFSNLLDVYGYANPKSSTGRNDVHVRLLTNGISRYDTVNSGYRGDLWVVVIPKSFPVILHKNQSLIQLRFFNKDTRLRGLNLSEFIEKENPILTADGKDNVIRDFDGSILLTLDLSQEVIGWEYLGCNKIANFNQGKIKLAPQDFFRRMQKDGEYISLKKGSFYILSTYEWVCVPPDYACEMRPMDERAGEFRSHYAGFIDPGWGYGKGGEGLGRQLTLEVRPFEDLVIRHRQPIAKIKFEKMCAIPSIHYDVKDSSNYSGQSGPTLSKFFAV